MKRSAGKGTTRMHALVHVVCGGVSCVSRYTLTPIVLCCYSKPQNSDILATQSNEILTAVIQGARKEEPSQEVQLAAVQALYNSLEFVRANFEREVRFFIFSLFFAACPRPPRHCTCSAMLIGDQSLLEPAGRAQLHYAGRLRGYSEPNASNQDRCLRVFGPHHAAILRKNALLHGASTVRGEHGAALISLITFRY